MRKVRILFLLIVLTTVKSYGQFYSLRTNLLGDATGNFNIEGAMTLNKKWSIHLPVQYNPFIYSPKKNTKFQNLTISPQVRYWFKQSFMDQFASISIIASRFHISNIWNNYRYDGVGAGVGLSYGCTYPLNPRWNFEWEIGIAGMWVNCDKYVNKAAGYKFKDMHEWKVIPHKLSASIVYLF